MSTNAPSRRSTVRRLPERARYDHDAILAILDEGLVCHVGFVDEGQPFVIPTAYGRLDDRVVVHGSAASRMIRALASGTPACLTVTLLDGLVLARSAFHHSMNYRSVVVLGRAEEIVDPEHKRRALDAIVEHIVPGRGAEVRPSSEKELRATRVVAFRLDEASAKLRVGPPKDDAEDLARACWAGELPLRLVAQEPVADPQLPADAPASPALERWRRHGRARA